MKRVFLILVLAAALLSACTIGTLTRWNAFEVYSRGDYVLFNRFQYTSLRDGNVGHTPMTSPDWWGAP